MSIITLAMIIKIAGVFMPRLSAIGTVKIFINSMAG